MNRPAAKPCRMTMRFLLCMALAAAAMGSARSQPAAGSIPDSSLLKIGYLSNLFVGFTPEDAKAATRVWSDRMLAAQGSNRYRTIVATYDSMPDVEAALKSHELDFFTISSRDYLEWRDRLDAVPWAMSVVEISMNYVLVTNKHDEAGGIAGLRGKNLLIAPTDRGLIPETWLNVSLLSQKLPEMDSFFGSVKEVNKPERAVLPVFFGKADACLIRKDAYRLVCELNPQLAQRLAILAETPDFLHGIFCIRKDYDPARKTELTRNLMAIGETIEGRQILDLFRAGRTTTYDPARMVSVEKLFDDYKRLAGHAPKPLATEPEISAKP